MKKLLLCGFLFLSLPALAAHGIALFGEPALPKEFAHFDYVNPNAPKGGTLKLAMAHGFDTLNPFGINGLAPAGIGMIHDSLMKQNANESFAQYGLIAKDVHLSKDRKQVTFTLNPKATFNNGTSITAEDVLFSFETLKEKGTPIYRVYFQEVAKAEALSPHKVRFTLQNTNTRELPLILGQLPVLSKTYWQEKDFTKTSLDIPVSSGPYLIADLTPNRSITYRRNPTYWAKDLNTNVGFYNFKEIRYDTYLDSTVTVEALRAGEIDLHQENVAKRWNAEQDWEEVKTGMLKTDEIFHNLPSGMQGYVFNLRNPLFRDIRVRKALNKLMDFEWINNTLFYGLYRRTESYYDNSELKAPPLPTKAEIKLLKPLQKHLPESVTTSVFQSENLPVREALKEALDLLSEAGWQVNNNVLQKDGKPFSFTLLLDAASAPVWERVALPFIARLKRLGIQADIQTLDILQYKKRVDNFEYDMIVSVWGNSLSPGGEQADFWGSAAANQTGSNNLTGLQNPAVDTLIQHLMKATTKAELLTAVHALDRALLHQYLVIPHWYSPATRLIYKPNLNRPSKTPLNGLDLMTWWKNENSA